MAKACIICAKEVDSGQKVSDDPVIHLIRRVKQALNIARNNELVVCSGCHEEYTKRRASYERRIALYAVISGAVLVLLVVVPILAGSFSLIPMFLGIFLALLLIALPVMTSHTPKLESAVQGGPISPVLKPSQKKAKKKK